MILKSNGPTRILTRFVVLFLPAMLVTNTSCTRSSDSGGNGSVSNSNASSGTENTSSTPPFPTKEPARYQATWVTSGSGGPQSENNPGLALLTNRQMPIARDGEKRRMETEVLPGVKVVYLQLATGRYALYPARKLYAEIKLDGSDKTVTPTPGAPSDFSPDKLISGVPAGAKYEKLGTEEVNGRVTTKYRVTSGGDASASASETTIWVDESLGMPIKSVMTSKEGATFSLELRDIKLEVDPSMFELPKDYRKVEHSELLSSALPSIKDVLGIDSEKKTTKKR